MAVGHAVTRSARPLPHVANAQAPDWTALARAIREWGPDGLVVGLPLDLDGNVQAITQAAQGFALALGERFGLPVYLCDERLSSRAADAELRDARSSGRMGRRVRKGDRDGVAAQLILEQWLGDHHAGRAP